MKKINYMIIGIIIGVFISVPAFSFASNIGIKVEAIFQKFNFIVNGEVKELEVDPLVYQGTTYLPVRVVANMLGYDVTYKADSRTITLNSDIINNYNHKGDVQLSPNSDLIVVNDQAEQTITVDGLDWKVSLDDFAINEPTENMSTYYPDVVGYLSFKVKIIIPQNYDLDNHYFIIYGDIDENYYRLREELGRQKYPLQHGENIFDFDIPLRDTMVSELTIKITDNRGNQIANIKWAI